MRTITELHVPLGEEGGEAGRLKTKIKFLSINFKLCGQSLALRALPSPRKTNYDSKE
jgi:hypothetical protein